MNAPASLRQSASTSTDAGSPLPPILQPYLLVLFSVPFHVDAAGRRWIDPLWAKDLLEHTRYIKRLTLAAKTTRDPLPAGAVAMDSSAGLRDVTCLDLPAHASRLAALLTLPRTLSALWRGLDGARIVHTGVVSWPIPEAWLLMPMLWFRRRLLYINIESAFWRVVPGTDASPLRRLRAALVERINRACVERSSISTFTHEGYRQSLLQRHRERGHVVEASWIDESNLVSQADLALRIERRRLAPGRLRLVFAAKLNEAKGLTILMNAVAALVREGLEIELDIYGAGPLHDEVAALIRDPALQPKIRLCGSLAYGEPFFEALRNYDALLVPSISDEQPRIVFDAFSQGLPVIASRTPGLAQCVDDGKTGFLFPPGDVGALQTIVRDVSSSRAMLSDMAFMCLARATGLTHRKMHEKRWRLLVDAFPALARP